MKKGNLKDFIKTIFTPNSDIEYIQQTRRILTRAFVFLIIAVILVTVLNFIKGYILTGILTSFIALVTIIFMDKKVYTFFNGSLSLLTSIFIIISALMILYRKDKRGLHDMMAGSLVIKEKK